MQNKSDNDIISMKRKNGFFNQCFFKNRVLNLDKHERGSRHPSSFRIASRPENQQQELLLKLTYVII